MTTYREAQHQVGMVALKLGKPTPGFEEKILRLQAQILLDAGQTDPEAVSQDEVLSPEAEKLLDVIREMGKRITH